jgi:outer membrane receptor protein involved in Fe transport
VNRKQAFTVELPVDMAGLRFSVDHEYRPGANGGLMLSVYLEYGGTTYSIGKRIRGPQSSGVAAQEIFDLVDTLNDEREQQLKRWGVRPHKISLFTAYDFKQGRLAGFTIGGGWRWRSANVIGSNSRDEEITGKVITAADAMMAYSRRFKGLPGRVRFQLNVSNLFDNDDPLIFRRSGDDSYATRVRLVDGRAYRLSASIKF